MFTNFEYIFLLKKKRLNLWKYIIFNRKTFKFDYTICYNKNKD